MKRVQTNGEVSPGGLGSAACEAADSGRRGATGDTNLGVSHSEVAQLTDFLGPGCLHDPILRDIVTVRQRHFVTKSRSHGAMETIGGRIRRLREAKGLSRADLAKAVGLAYSSLSDLESGKAKTTTVLHKIAAQLGARVEYLETGKGPQDQPPPSSDDEAWENIKGYAMAVGLGHGREALDYEETHNLKFRADSLARKRLRADKLAVLYGKGDSMLPRIREGDAILFDTSDTTPSDGDLFVIAMEGAGNTEYNVKRCEIVDDMVFFRADNPSGDHNWRRARAMQNKRNPITIVGRVRWIGSWEG
jgi:phage repressor protein C with HTH and peptisase S24 domain